MSEQHNPHEKIEKNVGLLAVLIAVAVSFGGLAEIVPLMYQAEAIQPLPGVKPYPALELAGRDVYVREGCYNCHSQMVRTLRFETERYENALDGATVQQHMRTLQRLGDPYTDAEVADAAADVQGKTELDAVVAYLQGLGKHAPKGG